MALAAADRWRANHRGPAVAAFSKGVGLVTHPRSVSTAAQAVDLAAISFRGRPVRRIATSTRGTIADQGPDPIGALARERLGDPAADVVPREHGPVQIEFVDQSLDAARLRVGAVLLGRIRRVLVGPAEPSRSGTTTSATSDSNGTTWR